MEDRKLTRVLNEILDQLWYLNFTLVIIGILIFMIALKMAN
jgi:hypothetical protein